MDVLNIFYNQVVPEASKGRVDCYFYLNILFNTFISENKIFIKESADNEDVIVPTLMIKNKQLFDLLLIKYVNLAKEFYKDDKQLNEVKIENKEEKLLLTLLWSNATIEDYNDPIHFLEKRIAFMESSLGELKNMFGYSNILDGNIELTIKKDLLVNETPYKMVFSLCNKENNNYYFPEVKFGIYEDSVYIYAIQNKNQESSPYVKKVNRALYKVGEGFDSNLDNVAIYEEGNLKDISASFLVVLNMAIAYFNSLGYQKIIVSSILPTRWNAKRIAIEKAAKKFVLLNTENSIKDQDRIQSNLTEKFLRTFLRLAHHCDGINIMSYPYENDSNLTIYLHNEIKSNNALLNETFEIINQNKKSHKL